MEKGLTNLGAWMNNSLKYVHQHLDDQVEGYHLSQEAINSKFEGIDSSLARADEALGSLRGR